MEKTRRGLWTRQRGSKVGGFVAWQPGLVPAVTTPSIDQFITHLTTFGYCAPRCVILMSQLGRSTLDRCSVCAWITYISMLSFSLSLALSPFQLSSDNPLTGWIDTTYGRISFVDPILSLESRSSTRNKKISKPKRFLVLQKIFETFKKFKKGKDF